MGRNHFKRAYREIFYTLPIHVANALVKVIVACLKMVPQIVILKLQHLFGKEEMTIPKLTQQFLELIIKKSIVLHDLKK